MVSRSVLLSLPLPCSSRHTDSVSLLCISLLAPAPCSQASNGCPWKDQRSLLSKHLETCPFEAIKSFFVLNDARVSAESAMRREADIKVEQLQDDVVSLRRDLDGTKKQLEDARQVSRRRVSISLFRHRITDSSSR